jgi:aminopeptidase YwaD
MKRSIYYFITFFLLITRAEAQSFDFADNAIEQRIRKDISILAGDSLLGREAGSEGEYMARMYISSQFKEIGIKPLFTENSYFQQFSFNDVTNYGVGNRLIINGKYLNLYNDFYALAFTGNDSAKAEAVFVGYGISAPDQNYDDYKGLSDLQGKVFIINTSLPDQLKSNPAIVKVSGKADKAALAINKGAAGVIFVRPNNNEYEPWPEFSFSDTVRKIPVIFLRNRNVLDNNGKNNIDMKVSINRDRSHNAYNVAGYIDNGAESWVVIGAHYDHMGWDIAKSGQREIHNGADDNASGTVAVLELARYFKNNPSKKNNYIFIAFSAEEKGLLGSSYFARSDIAKSKNINYMIDFDMVGKLSNKDKMIIFGTGTSPTWRRAINQGNNLKLKIVQARSGVGGSDHMSFYLNGIPDIFLHTGLHPDYHTPADDANKLDYKGETQVIKFAENLIEYLNDKGKLKFHKTSAWSAIWGTLRFL